MGIHVEPESDEEHAALDVVTRNLKFVDVELEVPTGPVLPCQEKRQIGGRCCR